MRRSQRMRSGQPFAMRRFTPSSPLAATVTWAPRAVSMSRASSRWSRSSSTTSTETPRSGIGEPLWPEYVTLLVGAIGSSPSKLWPGSPRSFCVALIKRRRDTEVESAGQDLLLLFGQRPAGNCDGGDLEFLGPHAPSWRFPRWLRTDLI